MAKTEGRQNGGIHIRKMHNRSRFQCAQEVKDQATKVLGKEVGDKVGKQVGDQVGQKAGEVLGDKGQKTVEDAKKKLENWDPFKKKKN